MYDKVEKTEVLSELNSGSDMYVVDIPTERVMDCSQLTMGAIISFIDKAETMFFKKVAVNG